MRTCFVFAWWGTLNCATQLSLMLIVHRISAYRD